MPSLFKDAAAKKKRKKKVQKKGFTFPQDAGRFQLDISFERFL